VDGFRFDLASILGRGRDGSVLSNPPLIERIAEDPILANTKLIAEAWDAAGLYQVGEFPHFKRWMEWNGKFRDDVRRFVRGDKGLVSAIATRLAGSSDLYEDDGREPFHSVNFVTCHDGFTLNDMTMYNRKHNIANGEDNRDGSDFNLSWNCGVEGETSDPEINTLRRRQIRNYAALLLLSQGIPMILAGDEFGRTQQGNNNPYCQDNTINWLNWKLTETNQDLLRFFKLLIAFRKEQPALHRKEFKVRMIKNKAEMSWHGVKIGKPDWSENSRTLGLLYTAASGQNDIYILLNMDSIEHIFRLPALKTGKRWFLKMDTFAEYPSDIFEKDAEQECSDQHKILVNPGSVVLLISK
jgi:glycogen operon protein